LIGTPRPGPERAGRASPVGFGRAVRSKNTLVIGIFRNRLREGAAGARFEAVE
jgi:hypothetical protein